LKDERDAQADRRSRRQEDEAKSCAEDDSDFKPIVGTRLRPSEAALSVKYGYVWNCPPASFYSEGRAGEDGEKEGAGMVYRVKKKAFFGDVGGDGVPGGQRRGTNNRSNAEKRDAHATPMEASRPVKSLTSAAVNAQKEGATGRSVGQQQQRARDHLDDENVRLVVEAIPRACDGRILVEHEMASIIGKRSDGLRERIASMDENPSPESHLVKENARTVWGQTRRRGLRSSTWWCVAGKFDSKNPEPRPRWINCSGVRNGCYQSFRPLWPSTAFRGLSRGIGKACHTSGRRSGLRG